jgi:hypothetical protein
MTALFKYAIVLASGVVIGLYLNRPMSLERVANLARIDDTEAIVVDPASAGGVGEDLDYLIAKRTGTLEGWRAFLAAHASGVHAKSAEAEIDKLTALVKPAAAQTSPEAKIDSEAARVAPALVAAAPALHQVCNSDGDCLGGLQSSPSGDETPRIANEPEPWKPTPQVVNLTDSSATAADQPDLSAKVIPDPVSKSQAIGLHRGTAVSSHIIPRRRQQPCGLRIECQPIIMALLGVKPKHSTFADTRPSVLMER